MFGTLIESRAEVQRRTGSSIASVVLHAVIIAGAVGLTAREAVTAVPGPETVITRFLLRPPPVEPVRTTNPLTTATTSVAAVPPSLVLRTPLIVPTEIPAIDLIATPTSNDFGDRRVASTGLFCDRDCPRTGVTIDGPGRDSWTANDVMMRLRDNPVPPRYPEALRRAGIEGSVTVRFVVDTTGRVDTSSIEVLRSTHDAFVVAVRQSLAQLRFNPSMVGNRKVAAIAMMPFQFTLK
ncbi:MAG: energy transducer TonB [Gemmatimonadaceae bacterium]